MPKLAISEIKTPRFSWVNVTEPGKAELARLARRFGFLDVDLKDCPPPLQRPKLIERQNYLFMILLVPVFDRKTKKINPIEIDFFIGRNYLATVHDDQSIPLRDFFGNLSRAGEKRKAAMGENSAELTAQILDLLLDSCFPMLVHLAADIDGVESRMTEVHNRNTIHEIFRVKTNIVNFEKSIQPHKTVIRKLIVSTPRFSQTADFNARLERLVDHTKEIWDALEANSKTLAAVEDTHLSLLNFRSNDIIRMLTIFAVIVFPLTLFASIFGMNTRATPIIGHPLDFWIIVNLMLAGMLSMVAYFKWKKWF